ncbi:acid phosphatase [Methylosinus sp. Sm6]|uniref:acid phosphatase n=1 Tax=Methylosinus sp. Sm6 TaxID=2866948 RepID=UPI001C9942FC|nr:acid phosphatase [Methylosinus sp. Sm6]MBY6243454.1 acid phosphatase [Methylosinus sp. Sm6]
MRMSIFRSFAAATALLALANAPGSAQEAANPFAEIGHIVVIYTENRSFDNVFGLFPGADGLGVAADRFAQADADGSVLTKLPPIPAHKSLDPRFPQSLPNAPFPIDAFAPNGEKTADLTHDFYQEQEQINGGRMDRFAAVSSAGGLVMGYYDGRGLAQWRLAEEFTLADHFFHAAFGGSFLNHVFLVCACAPVYPSPPPSLVAEIDEKTGFLARADNSPKSALDGPPRYRKTGRVTPDGFAVSTLQPPSPLSPIDLPVPAEQTLPPQAAPTIGDRLTEKGVGWAWFAGGWNDMRAGRIRQRDKPDYFQTHHQPFLYFAKYAPGSAERERHLKDAEDFFAAAAAGTLPAVSFYKPIGRVNQHPDYADLKSGDAHIAEVVARLRASPNWKDMLIIITADENGGAWDHVAPPKIDRFGPGSRVPTLIVSPLAKKGFVDHTAYDTTSILRTIEMRFGLEPLTDRDARAADLRNALLPSSRTDSAAAR